MEFFKQQSSIDPLTLGLLGASAGFLDPQGGMSAGFQGAMQGMMAGQDMQYRNAMAQMQQNKFLRSEMARGLLQETLRQHTRPDGTVDHKAAINALTASGMPELMGHVKTLQSALPQYKARYEVMGEGGAPKMMAINQFGETNELPGTPWKAPIRMDLGGSAALIDPSTNQPRAQFRKSMSPDASANLGQRQYEFGIENARNNARFALDYNPDYQAEMATAKTTATERAKNKVEAVSNLPKVLDQGNESIKLLDDLINHPGFGIMVGKSNPIGEVAGFIPGTDARDFKARFEQVKGKQFLEAFETLKGGGQITEIEGVKATQAISRMERAQSEREFINAAKEFQGIIKLGMERAAKKAGQQMPQQQRKSYMSPDGWSSIEN